MSIHSHVEYLKVSFLTDLDVINMDCILNRLLRQKVKEDLYRGSNCD